VYASRTFGICKGTSQVHLASRHLALLLRLLDRRRDLSLAWVFYSNEYVNELIYKPSRRLEFTLTMDVFSKHSLPHLYGKFEVFKNLSRYRFENNFVRLLK